MPEHLSLGVESFLAFGCVTGRRRCLVRQLSHGVLKRLYLGGASRESLVSALHLGGASRESLVSALDLGGASRESLVTAR
jgi:hypothetical protein